MAAPTVRDDASGRQPGDDEPGHFLLVLGLEQTETRPLPRSGALSVGRDEDADVRIVDALASRAHARLYLGATIELEDLGSANGTRLRDQRIAPHQRVTVLPGEAVAIGNTVLVIQRREPAARPRRVFPHGYFEARLIETCAQTETVKGTFAVARLHLEIADEPAAIDRAERLLLGSLRPGDVLAAYGPGEYEVLLVDSDKASAEELIAETLQRLQGARAGMAFFPDDATSPEALVTCACDRVRPAGLASRPPGIVISNPAMRALYALAEKAARGTINVLILGETGAGKENLAETVHRHSPRARGPFLSLNCAALSETLLESELFGYEKGAFTGATQARAGLLEAASGGTLFLDEVGEMTLNLQAKVLRAIETKQVMRVGATSARAVDVRFVAATNRDLDEEVAAKRFRQDLYFRLNGIALQIPPLRERLDELPELAALFLQNAAAQLDQPAPRLSPEALAELRAHAWPGNLRELRNMMERALLLSSAGAILPEHLPREKMLRARAAALPPGPAPTEGGGAPMSLVELEKRAMLDALARCAGNQTRAAELLGMPRRTFCKRMSEYNLPRPRG
jgi:DNA-binding NtrC family response regulator